MFFETVNNRFKGHPIESTFDIKAETQDELATVYSTFDEVYCFHDGRIGATPSPESMLMFVIVLYNTFIHPFLKVPRNQSFQGFNQEGCQGNGPEGGCFIICVFALFFNKY